MISTIEYVKKYFPDAIEIARKCNCCNQAMYSRKTYTDIKERTVYHTLEQCLNVDCWDGETETVDIGYVK
jgi:hypothetical protein